MRRNPWLQGRRLNPGDSFSEAAPAFSRALAEVRAAAERAGVRYALIGGQALISYGVPRDSLDVDVVSVDPLSIAQWLVDVYAWIPLRYDRDSRMYVQTDCLIEHQFHDHALYELGVLRSIYFLESPEGVKLDLLLSQHPMERSAISNAIEHPVLSTSLQVAPLGAVLVLKAKAARRKDEAAIEAAFEWLDSAAIYDAIAWADARDPEAARGLRRMLHEVDVRSPWPVDTPDTQ